MTKEELTKALEPFTPDTPIYRPMANKYGEETFKQPIQRVVYSYDPNEGGSLTIE